MLRNCDKKYSKLRFYKITKKENRNSKSRVLIRYKNYLKLQIIERIVTRDTFKMGTVFTIQTIGKVVKAIASAAAHLHSHGLMHGDLYAHNILINNTDHCYLGDFGAASFYEPHQKECEKIEVRAFGCLLEDMLSLCPLKEGKEYEILEELRSRCMDVDRKKRPLFSEILV